MASSPAAFSSSFLLFLICLSAGCAMAKGTRLLQDDDMLHLRYYTVNSTVSTVVGLNTTNHNVSTFGDIGILNGDIYERGELNQPAIGTSGGLAVGATLTDKTYLSILNVVFTAGRYNGSSLILIGKLSERAIVGGGGLFRLAQGYVEILPIQTSPVIVVQFDFYVLPNRAFYY